jgi:hypothetical protein
VYPTSNLGDLEISQKFCEGGLFDASENAFCPRGWLVTIRRTVMASVFLVLWLFE